MKKMPLFVQIFLGISLAGALFTIISFGILAGLANEAEKEQAKAEQELKRETEKFVNRLKEIDERRPKPSINRANEERIRQERTYSYQQNPKTIAKKQEVGSWGKYKAGNQECYINSVTQEKRCNTKD